MVTGSEEADSLEKCVEMGAYGYLNKPIDPELLTAFINRLCKDEYG